MTEFLIGALTFWCLMVTVALLTLCRLTQRRDQEIDHLHKGMRIIMRDLVNRRPELARKLQLDVEDEQ